MDKDFSELIEYLDGKFVKVDQRFIGVDQRFVSLEQKFIEMNERIGDLAETKADKSDINNLMMAIDAYAKKADTYFQEMVMLAHKVDKMEKWIQQIADKVGIKLVE